MYSTKEQVEVLRDDKLALVSGSMTTTRAIVVVEKRKDASTAATPTTSWPTAPRRRSSTTLASAPLAKHKSRGRTFDKKALM
jgi:hypothetical protein